jgi:hypothetical protein
MKRKNERWERMMKDFKKAQDSVWEKIKKKEK